MNYLGLRESPADNKRVLPDELLLPEYSASYRYRQKRARHEEYAVFYWAPLVAHTLVCRDNSVWCAAMDTQLAVKDMHALPGLEPAPPIEVGNVIGLMQPLLTSAARATSGTITEDDELTPVQKLERKRERDTEAELRKASLATRATLLVRPPAPPEAAA